MDQKFVKFEEARAKLGVSADRLNQLREDGELRAYRDGASWKFRADEIDRMAHAGVPDPPPPSDVGLVDQDDLVEASPLEPLDDLGDLGLAEDDDTVTAGEGSIDLGNASDEPSDPSDSILLSDETLGESSTAPPSTIIGKSELESKDADLELVTDEPGEEGSDVRLASGASDVLSAGVAGSGVLDDAEKEASHASAFEKLEELEIDLAAESSRILSPEDLPKPQAKAASADKKTGKKPDSDLTLNDLELAGADEGTDPEPAGLAKAKSGGKPKDKSSKPSSDLELATEEDDFVLAEAGGSDITLDTGDSGINLVDPSDSGLALDDIPLEMGGSAILESLSIGDKGNQSDLSLVGSDIVEKSPPPAPAKGGKAGKQVAAIQTDDDFRLTPLGDAEEDGDSSSQVIALDADIEELGAGDAGILGDEVFAEEPSTGVAFAEDYEAGAEGGFEAATYSGAVARSDSEYSVAMLMGMGSCVVLLLFGMIVMMDMVRNIWAWDQNLALNDSLLDSLLGLFGMT